MLSSSGLQTSEDFYCSGGVGDMDEWWPDLCDPPSRSKPGCFHEVEKLWAGDQDKTWQCTSYKVWIDSISRISQTQIMWSKMSPTFNSNRAGKRKQISEIWVVSIHIFFSQVKPAWHISLRGFKLPHNACVTCVLYTRYNHKQIHYWILNKNVLECSHLNIQESSQ